MKIGPKAESQAGCLRHDRSHRQLAFVQQVCLIRADMIGAKLTQLRGGSAVD
jgi:hypothetical protein